MADTGLVGQISPRLELRGMRRTFGKVRAVWDVDLQVTSGSIHALLGENGAGKSTLMNIAFGLHHRDAGVILIDGVEVDVQSPADAIAAGVAMVHQHHMLVPSLTVAETIALATPVRRVGWNRRAADARVRELAERMGLDIDPQSRIEDLSLAGRQRVEILTALHRDVRVLILDEPTAVLSPSEVEPFFALLRRMAAEDRSIILITHRMREVFAVCDRISVMRKGGLVSTESTVETNPQQVLEHVVTSPVSTISATSPVVAGLSVESGAVEYRVPSGPGSEVLRVTGLQTPGAAGSTGLRDCGFVVRAGEVLGIAGVEGNGQGDLVNVLAGVAEAVAGSVELHGKPVSGRLRRDQLTVIPEDRHREGLVLDLSVAENLVLDHLREYSRGGLLRRASIRDHSRNVIREYAVVAAGPDAPVRSMSGGNQQKLVLARALQGGPASLVASQATRGLDPGAAGAVLGRLRAARDAGTAIVYIGSDLDEVIEISDRVGVLYGGRIVGVADHPVASRDQIAAWMVGEGVHAAAREAA